MMKLVYTLDDLVSRDVLDAGANQPARLAVLGWPVAHSASPRMHQPALEANEIATRYIRLEVEPGNVPAAFARMRSLGFIGCNVTVPHKLDALENCDELAPAARVLGAVNTVRFDADATRGFNTDGPGYANAIEEAFGVTLASLRVVIAGAGGGAGQAITAQCVLLGVEKLVLVNRTVDKIELLKNRLKTHNGNTEIIALAFDDPALADHCRSCDLLVNTSSLGLKPGDSSILNSECMKPAHFVYDTIYQPAVTPFLALANQLGCRTANGLSMLIHQGALAFQLWFPETKPLAVMRMALAQGS